jgi:hypothetical protein
VRKGGDISGAREKDGAIHRKRIIPVKFKKIENAISLDWKGTLRDSEGRHGIAEQDHLKAAKLNEEVGDYANAGRNYLAAADSESLRMLDKENGSRHNSPVSIVLMVISLALGIFFLSGDMTGNTVADLTLETSTGIGIILILFGMMCILFCFKKNKLRK